MTSLRLEIVSGGVIRRTAAAAARYAVAHIRRGQQEPRAGRLDAAESEFRAALAADAKSATAHTGLRKFTGGGANWMTPHMNFSFSRDTRLRGGPNHACAIYLEQKKNDLARAEAESAIKLAPNYPEAKELLDHLQKAKPSGGAQ